MPVSQKAIKQRYKIFHALQKLHPGAWTELKYKTPLQLLVAVILSAQATDKSVNAVTPKLFKKYKTAKDYARAPLAQLDGFMSKINFHKNKARAIQKAGIMLAEKYGGQVPRKLDELVELPGVGRKTANVVLGHAFGRAEGVVVDTHVARLAQRLGWTNHSDPSKIELDLMRLFPKRLWVKLSDTLILHGRYVCKSKSPSCQQCPFEPFCPGQQH